MEWIFGGFCWLFVILLFKIIVIIALMGGLPYLIFGPIVIACVAGGGYIFWCGAVSLYRWIVKYFPTNHQIANYFWDDDSI